MNQFNLLASLLVVALASSLTVAQNVTTTPNANITTTPTTTTPTTPTTTPAKTNTTTTPASTNTTTQAKTTSTTTATTTTITTTLAPSESSNTYNVTDKNGTVCIKMEAKIDFEIKYSTKKDGNVTKTVPIPAEFTTMGNCGDKTQSLSIQFYKDWQLTFTFQSQDSTHYDVSNVFLSYTLDKRFPDATNPMAKMTANITTGSDFMKGNKDGYICNSKTGKQSGNVKINTEDLKYKAFNNDKTIELSSNGLECSADEDTNSIVPIAVGAALAGLVVIVLIAYLIGRKRTRKTGYESV